LRPPWSLALRSVTGKATRSWWTVGLNDAVRIGNYPHTERLHMIERYRRVDYGHLENRVTYEDPGAFRKPWHVNLLWDLAPEEELLEIGRMSVRRRV
jgi:hypothetical protein